MDPYPRISRGTGSNADVSSIDFKASRGSSGVDLRWHPKEECVKLSQEKNNELGSWLHTPEGIKQKRKNFKIDNRRRGKSQKCIANNSSGNDLKCKFRKAIKTDQGLKSIMSIMDTEERAHRAIVSALVASNSQPSVPGDNSLVSAFSACIQPTSTTFLVRPSAPNAATTADVPINPPTQDTISTVAQTFFATNVKFQTILKK